MEPVLPPRCCAGAAAGLATLDEHAVAACGFERLLFVRPTQRRLPVDLRSAPQRLARWMLSQLRYMIRRASSRCVPTPSRPSMFEVLRQWPDAPAGTRVAAAPLVWQAAQRGGPGRWCATGSARPAGDRLTGAMADAPGRPSGTAGSAACGRSAAAAGRRVVPPVLACRRSDPRPATAAPASGADNPR
jgi:hypothetical protein